ncbi:hypothetical protein V5799_023999 [Amblyomma americanum]|uniref:Uncharacterized protein n=1 Tax=Amblyomma americanum TaxID=6943 RepID=A0AAQ4EDF0_AMBAM
MTAAIDSCKYGDFLPALAWDTICSLLDAGSLMAFAEAVPSLGNIAFQKRIVRALKFTTDTDKCTIQAFHRANIANQVKKLEFNNCIALSSEDLLGCISSCINLEELYSVNCVIEPSKLFDLLRTTLTQVRKLEWSLHEGCFYSTWPSFAIQSPNMQLESMYMELVATPRNIYLLEVILQHCPSLKILHIHIIQKGQLSLQMVDLCMEFTRVLLSLNTFTFTSEQIFTPEAIEWTSWWWPNRVQADYIMFGNISYQLKPVNSRNVIIFEDGVQNGQLRGIKQAIVVMQDNGHVDRRRLSELARSECWADVSSLCLVLTAPSEEQPPGTATASSYYIDATQCFLKSCVPNITELNLASFHFDQGSDGSEIVGSTLPHLRALALAPCGVNHADSLSLLARGCMDLEELDVRAERDSNGVCPCVFCRVPLRFSKACFKELHERTKLRRLSLDDTAKLESLDFLRECRVVELRFSLSSLEEEVTDTASFLCGLSWLLGRNPRLSFLTVETRGAHLRSNEFAEGLAAISTLRHLCVLMEAVMSEDHVANFFR